jgi:hypothetical protein
MAQTSAVAGAALPLTWNPRADARFPTSPRKRGEVTGRASILSHALSLDIRFIPTNRSAATDARIDQRLQQIDDQIGGDKDQ